MVLRRPTLLFNILTIALGVNYHVSRPSLVVLEFSSVQNLRVVLKRYVVTDPEVSGEHSGVLELPGENDHNGRSLGSKVYGYHGENIKGRERLCVQPSRHLHVQPSEETAWTITSSSPSSRSQLPEHTVNDSSSFYQSQPLFSSSKRDSKPLSEDSLAKQQLSTAPKAQTAYSALSHPLPELVFLSTKHCSDVCGNQSEKSSHRTVTDDLHSISKNSPKSPSSAALNACSERKHYQDNGTLQMEPHDRLSHSKVLQEIKNEIRSRKVQAPESEEVFKNTINKSFLAVLESGETCYQIKTVSLYCLCVTLMFSRKEDLKQKVIVPLLHTLRMTPIISDLVKTILERLTTTSSWKELYLQYDLDKMTSGPADNPKKGQIHSLPKRKSQSWHFPLALHKQPKAAATCAYQPCHRSTDYAAYIPRRPVTYTVFPASFLPSVGSSPQNSMSFLGSRLASLNSLPASCNVSRVRLAQAGFYYDTSKTHRGPSNIHEVACYSCGLSYGQWKDGDNPELIHRQLRPDCPYLKENGNSSNNIELPSSLFTSGDSSVASGSSETASLASVLTNGSASSNASSGYWSMNGESMPSDVRRSGADSFPPTSTTLDGSSSVFCMNSTMTRNTISDLQTDCAAITPSDVTPNGTVTNQKSSTFSRPARDAVLTAPSTNRSSVLGSGMDQHTVSASSREERPQLSMKEVVYPQFSRLQDRQATFGKWPQSHFLRPDDLVLQGFYYAGYADCIRCFYCGVGLKSWCQDDDVMVEHIRWRPSCGYIRNTQGQQFVNNILKSIQASALQQPSNQTTGQIENQGGPEICNTNGPRQPTKSAPSTTTNPAPSTTTNLAPSTTTNPAPSTTTNSARSTTMNPAPSTTTGPTLAVPSIGGRNAAEASRDLLRSVMDMGFNSQTVTTALQQLQHEGVRAIGVEELVGRICEMDRDKDEGIENDGQASSTDLQADGPEHQADSDRAQWLASENERLRQRNRCKLCTNAKVSMIFMPCGHLVACKQCGAKIRNCSSCGQYIKATADVFL